MKIAPGRLPNPFFPCRHSPKPPLSIFDANKVPRPQTRQGIGRLPYQEVGGTTSSTLPAKRQGKVRGILHQSQRKFRTRKIPANLRVISGQSRRPLRPKSPARRISGNLGPISGSSHVNLRRIFDLNCLFSSPQANLRPKKT